LRNFIVGEGEAEFVFVVVELTLLVVVVDDGEAVAGAGAGVLVKGWSSVDLTAEGYVSAYLLDATELVESA
jgi:hypothetical protein